MSADSVDRAHPIASGEFLIANPNRVCVNRAAFPGPDGPWEIWKGRTKRESHHEFTDAIAAAHQIAANGMKS